MFTDLTLWTQALPWLLAVAVVGWLASLRLRDASIVDSLWSLKFLLAGFVFAAGGEPSARRTIVLSLLAVWAVRLCVHITVRNHGHGEDRRYQAIRARNEPGFAWKSLYLVFVLQALLAWVIALPLVPALAAGTPPTALDGIAFLLWVVGFAFEAGGDLQLARFKRDPRNAGRVMDRGLWALTRHPNYFGDFCIWWAFGLFGLSADPEAWLVLVGPLLMSVLLLRVSGVALLEKDIGERRPAYADYVARTNAFFPWPARRRR